MDKMWIHQAFVRQQRGKDGANRQKSRLWLPATFCTPTPDSGEKPRGQTCQHGAALAQSPPRSPEPVFWHFPFQLCLSQLLNSGYLLLGNELERIIARQHKSETALVCMCLHNPSTLTRHAAHWYFPSSSNRGGKIQNTLTLRKNFNEFWGSVWRSETPTWKHLWSHLYSSSESTTLLI